jgi:hypothetical protein
VRSEEAIALTGWRTRRTHFNAFAQLMYSALDAGIAQGVLADAGVQERGVYKTEYDQAPTLCEKAVWAAATRFGPYRLASAHHVIISFHSRVELQLAYA